MTKRPWRRKQLGSLEEEVAIIPMPRDFALAWRERIRSKLLDDYTAGGAEMKASLVTTEVAYGNRDDCFACTPSLKAWW